MRTVRKPCGVKNLCEVNGWSVIRLSGPADLPYGFRNRRVLRNSTPESRSEPVSPQDGPGRALAHAPHRSGDRSSQTPRGSRNTGRYDRSGTLPPVPGRSAFHLALCALCCVLFSLITWQVAVGGPLLGADARLGEAFRSAAPPAAVAELLADLGNLTVALPVLAAATGHVAASGTSRGVRRWLPPLCALGAMGCVAVIVPLLKVSLGRPGPFGGSNYYPSGHTATAAVAFGGAALLLSLSVRRPPYWPLPAAAALLTLLCGAGLVWRGYHWPLDVVASLCLGWVLLAAATAVVRTGLRHVPPPGPPASPAPSGPPGPERNDGARPAT